MSLTATDSLGLMSEDRTFTLAEFARRLGVGVEAVLQLVYEGRLQPKLDSGSGRLLFTEQDTADLNRGGVVT
jgi:hypothetical protein